jgi:hypothetical protein
MLHHDYGQLAPLPGGHELVEDEIHPPSKQRPAAAPRHDRRLSPTIERCHRQVVVAIFKIEDGTLTLAGSDTSEPPESFADGSTSYVVKKVQRKEKNGEPPAIE